MGDLGNVAGFLASLAALALHRGDLTDANRLSRRSLALIRRVGARREIAGACLGRAYMLIYGGRFAESIEILDRALAEGRDLGDDFLIGSAHRHRCMAWAQLGEYDLARTTGETGLAIPRREGSKWHMAQALVGLGWTALGSAARAGSEDAYAEAAKVLRECVALSSAVRERRYHGIAAACLAYALRGQAQIEDAWQSAQETLHLAVDNRQVHLVIFALPAVALILADCGRAEQAVALYALASRSPFVANSRWFEDVAGRQVATLAAGLPTRAVAAARERADQCDLWATGKELLLLTEPEQMCYP